MKKFSHGFRPGIGLKILRASLKTNLTYSKNNIFASTNRKQALFPNDAIIIPNPTGTAPGMIWQPKENFTIITFPGVPSEMKTMWVQTVIPWLKRNL